MTNSVGLPPETGVRANYLTRHSGERFPIPARSGRLVVMKELVTL